MRPSIAIALALVVPFGLSACGGPKAGTFQTGTGAYPAACLTHQKVVPSAAYNGSETGDTAEVFAMMRYFTANRSVTAFCDGKPASAVDKKWVQTYLDLGGEPGNVSNKS